ncbi:cysteine/serine endopeptidase inhibitor, partial [Streptomyces yaanensis]
MRVLKRIRLWACALLTGLALMVLGSQPAFAAIPIGQAITGSMTYYNDIGTGSCGTAIDATSQSFVAVSYTYWTAANPNNDDLCKGISVQVTYNGKTITVPVVDKCPSCDSTRIDLSQPAFAQLADTGIGNVSGITWQFVYTNGGGNASYAALPGTWTQCASENGSCAVSGATTVAYGA